MEASSFKTVLIHEGLFMPLILNVDKTKEMIVDFRKNRPSHAPLLINSSAVEVVSSTKFLGVHITNDLTWTGNTTSLVKRAQKRLYFLRRMRRAHLPPPILKTFYRSTIESILTSCLSVWCGGCSASDWKNVRRVVRTAERIIGAPLPSIQDISSRGRNIVSDPSHPHHGLFSLLPSGKRFCSIRCRSTRFRNGLVDVGGTWQCPTSLPEAELAELQRSAVLIGLEQKHLTRLSNPRWLKGPLKTPGGRDLWTLEIPAELLP